MKDNVTQFQPMSLSSMEEMKPEEQIRELKKALSFAENGWKMASQANFTLSSRLEKILEDHKVEIKEKDIQIKAWREAYESVSESKTWRMATKLKRVIGKK